MPFQELIDIEDTVLFCQKMAVQLYASQLSSEHFYYDEEETLGEWTDKKRVKSSLKFADVLCDFVINPPEKIQNSTLETRKAAISDEIEYLVAIVTSEPVNISCSDDDIQNILKRASLQKRLANRVTQTQERVAKFSQSPTPLSTIPKSPAP